MANLGATFDATSVAPADDFTPLPAGDYRAMIIDSEMKPTKDGTGQYLAITMQVIDGQFQGRLIWDRLNLINRNPKAAEIAQRTLSAICHAVGVLQVQDSTQLHNRPMIVRVKFLEDPQYGPKNEVASYKPINGTGAPMSSAPFEQPAAAPVPMAPPPAQPAPAAAGAPPWAR